MCVCGGGGGGGGEGGLQQVGDLQASAHSVSLGAPPGVSVCVCVRVRVCVCVCVVSLKVHF